jgi:hypothetical protein
VLDSAEGGIHADTGCNIGPTAVSSVAAPPG